MIEGITAAQNAALTGTSGVSSTSHFRDSTKTTTSKFAQDQSFS